MLCIEEIAKAIERATGISVLPTVPPIKQHAEIISKLSKQFNSNEGGKTHIYNTTGWVDAYCMYFFPLNVIRAASVIKNTVDENADLIQKIYDKAKPEGLKIKFWDVGCGPGTASFAFKSILPEFVEKTNFLLIDANKKMLEKAVKIMNIKNIQTRCHNLLEDLTSVCDAEGTPDIIFMSNVFAEIEKPNIEAYIKTKAKLIFMMEPASLFNSRKLLAIRDNVISSKNNEYKIIYPCTTGNKCPALSELQNWCHQTVKWQRPEWIRLLDKQIAYNKTELDYTPMVFAHSTSINYDKSMNRIVSDISKKKWGNEFFICGDDGLKKISSKTKRLTRGMLVSS